MSALFVIGGLLGGLGICISITALVSRVEKIEDAMRSVEDRLWNLEKKWKEAEE